MGGQDGDREDEENDGVGVEAGENDGKNGEIRGDSVTRGEETVDGREEA